jgi:WhiB family redox-sensing transcriptional regulator
MFTADWIVEALCRGEDPEIFFPELGGTRYALRQAAAIAKTVCRRCPVQQACLDAALARNEHHGVWGGVHMGQTRSSTREEMRQIRGVDVDSGFIHGTPEGAKRHERAGEKTCPACRNAATAAHRRRKTEMRQQ